MVWTHILSAALAAAPPASGEEQLDGGAPEPPPEERGLQTVVTASRTEQRQQDVTVPTEVLTRRDIEISGARNLSELLETSAGIDIVPSPFAGVGVRLQGLDPEYVLLLVDGERVAGRVNGVLDLQRFSLSDVERVEIVKGPSSVLYGSEALAGVINLITRRPHRSLEGEARGSYGLRGEIDARAEGGGAVGGLRWRAGGGYDSASAYDRDPSNLATTVSGHGAADVGGAASLELPTGWRFGARVSYQRKDMAGIDSASTGAVFDRRNRTEHLGASLALDGTPLPELTVAGRVHYSLFRDQFLQDQRAARDLDLYQDAREQVGEVSLQASHAGWKPHVATVGAEALLESLRSPRLLNGVKSRRRVAAFAQDEWTILPEPRLALLAGARVDVDSGFGVSTSPRAAVRFVPVPGVTLRASVGGGFRAPSFQELALRFENPAVGYLVEGREDLRPEVGFGGSVSVDALLPFGVTLGASAYRTDVRDMVDIIVLQPGDPTTPTRFGYGNVAAARVQGVEASARVRIVSGTYLDLGYALTDARDLGRDRPLDGRALHRGSAQLTSRLRQWGVDGSLRLGLSGRRPFSSFDDPEVQIWFPGYAHLDVRLAKQLFGWMTVFVVAQNVLDAGDSRLLPLPPRGIQGGVSVRY